MNTTVNSTNKSKHMECQGAAVHGKNQHGWESQGANGLQQLGSQEEVKMAKGQMNEGQMEGSKERNVGSKTIGRISGASMDRAVSPGFQWKKLVYGGVACLAVALVAWVVVNNGNGRELRVPQKELHTAQVIQGIFEDSVPINAVVAPSKSIMLDVMDGGRVEKIYVEDGDTLKKGDRIADLSNTRMLLEVTQNEALVEERLNEFRSIVLQYEQSKLRLKTQISNNGFDIQQLERKTKQFENLFQQGFVTESELEDQKIALARAQMQREILLEQQASEDRLHEQQLQASKLANKRMQDNLEVSRKNLESLAVMAPQDGKLSRFSIELGQSILSGQRLGQIDSASHKLVGEIDQYYLNRLRVGQSTFLESQNEKYELKVSKIYPTIEQSFVSFDLEFVGDEPGNLTQGQSSRLDLILGDASDAVLLQKGSYLSETGGHWVMVIKDGIAEKRDITLGRRNSRYVEVLEGLEPDEEVILSGYDTYKNQDRLIVIGSN